MIQGAPEDYADTLGSLPERLTTGRRLQPAKCDFVQYFTKSRTQLAGRFPALKKALKKSGMLWISWPKSASGVATDVTENTVREIGLASGLVDVKVAAIDEIWSGLKFVYRRQDR